MIDASQNARSSVRATTNHLASIEWHGGSASAKVMDLSITGARIATQAIIPVGTEVIMSTVRMGSRPGHVVRGQDGEIAIHFTDAFARSVEANKPAAG